MGGILEGKTDLNEAPGIAMTDKFAVGIGMIAGGNSFYWPFRPGIDLLHAMPDFQPNTQPDIA